MEILVAFSTLAVPTLTLSTSDYSCSGHGAVGTTSNGSLACFCFPRWRGAHCEIPTCGLCVNGHCVSAGPGQREVMCQCLSGYGGIACDTMLCPEDCNNRGECHKGECRCDYLWTGSACNQPACPNGCSQHGRGKQSRE